MRTVGGGKDTEGVGGRILDLIRDRSLLGGWWLSLEELDENNVWGKRWAMMLGPYRKGTRRDARGETSSSGSSG